MRLVTKRELIATAAARYRETYQRRNVWLPTAEGTDTAAVYAALAALPPDAGEDAVIAVAGDDRWTANPCFECGADVSVTVLLAEQPSNDTSAVPLCLGCLEAALNLARSAGA